MRVIIPFTRILAVVFIVAAIPQQAYAGIRSCSSVLVTGGICTTASDGLLYFSLSTSDPDGAGPRVSVSTQVQEGCAVYFQYQPLINGLANPESKAVFCERQLRVLFKTFGDFYYRKIADNARDATLALTPSDIVP